MSTFHEGCPHFIKEVRKILLYFDQPPPPCLQTSESVAPPPPLPGRLQTSKNLSQFNFDPYYWYGLRFSWYFVPPHPDTPPAPWPFYRGPQKPRYLYSGPMALVLSQRYCASSSNHSMAPLSLSKRLKVRRPYYLHDTITLYLGEIQALQYYCWWGQGLGNGRARFHYSTFHKSRFHYSRFHRARFTSRRGKFWKARFGLLGIRKAGFERPGLGLPRLKWGKLQGLIGPVCEGVRFTRAKFTRAKI